MKINNEKFLKQCQLTKCFSSVPFNDKNFRKFKYKKPVNFFKYFWNKYERFKKKYSEKKGKEINNSYNGQALEIILAYLFTRENIKIEKMDEELDDVMFVKPDFLLKGDDEKKFFISVKVSIRERWKQADWEAIKYKEKYPNAFCALIINHKQEYLSMKKKIKHLDLDKVYLANSKDMNQIIDKLKE